ncbi:MAG: hypothetical protein M3018_01620 [Actinomycetota bacterium]|nr:hypothetical protein [Actinomycetota bacterium]
MAKTWVLETQTKGTGATMVPLERVQSKPAPPVPGFALPRLKESQPAEAGPRPPRAFKVVDVMTGKTVSEGLDARAAIAALERVRSIVDVTVYVWEADTKRWRLLTLGETRALWVRRAGALEAGTAGKAA